MGVDEGLRMESSVAPATADSVLFSLVLPRGVGGTGGWKSIDTVSMEGPYLRADFIERQPGI
jgi:hypothetical protein